jgi:hypothetical protein
MCDFDDFYDDDCGYEDDHDFSDEPGDGIENEPEKECEGWCFGDDLGDFMIFGGIIGYLEEEIQERKRLKRERKKKRERADKCKNGYDLFNRPDSDPYP